MKKEALMPGKEQIIQGKYYRFTLITEKLIRMEYSQTGYFEDRATQLVKHRGLGEVEYELKETEHTLEITTRTFHLKYIKEKEFSPRNLHIDVRYNYSNYTNRWYYGQSVDTLKGTLRTLDRVDGHAKLEESIISEFGYAALNDSKSFIFDEKEVIGVKDNPHTDVYFFAYGRNYLEAIQDFYRLSGFPPLLPRYALGNWWSRYWKYTEESYLKLIDRFEAEKIPLSVSVIDMEWHKTDVPSRYGSGWTGYSWNRDFFPDPKRFLSNLHERGLAVTLNVHPADGIRAFEDPYETVARRLDLNQVIEEPAQFDLMDADFRAAYFEDVHHPLEEEGIDFWWIDWQQGEYSSSDIDPLWLLNHYHFHDLKDRGEKALILSRYAGPGSHRYPIGFSGDSMITWDSLNFQPYLTSTSSNIGYTWWSHDIGGHYRGYKDEELVQRWFQFGVFSPINRLHSSNSAFSSKEPWNYSDPVKANMTKFLRLRHALLPYLYTANVLTHEKGIPLVQPVYYHYPFEQQSYDIKNEYFFGSELLVLPITSKKDDETLYGSDVIFFPEGYWFDIFSNRRYKGNAKLQIFRKPEDMPVFAKEGAIIPLDARPTETVNGELPEEIEWLVYPGKSNGYSMVEDQNGFRMNSDFSMNINEQSICMNIFGDRQIMPKGRRHTIHFNASEPVTILHIKNGKLINKTYSKELNRTSITVECRLNCNLEIFFEGFSAVGEQDINQELFERLNIAQVGYFLKDHLYEEFNKDLEEYSLLAMINELEEENLSRSLFELLYIKNS
ncbi:Maltodextrin glucosidase [Alkalibacterium sp. AK22]|uniref:glycoside hydrolase family 31 protein n=1 Tax=Alkalibacterium sp. AK22 TaxID=1229520 RepID=UPI00044F1BCF|nr:glycoside hydrolase family 31 protein [Alkalibacterium sp. AK22]EXJ23733.1 Maltodextrin glucosidase [Alkalibacterium sp. AK22]